jgi:hypothetical protein
VNFRVVNVFAINGANVNMRSGLTSSGAGGDGPQYGTTGPSAFNGYYEPSNGSNQYARSQGDAYNQSEPLSK